MSGEQDFATSYVRRAEGEKFLEKVSESRRGAKQSPTSRSTESFSSLSTSAPSSFAVVGFVIPKEPKPKEPVNDGEIKARSSSLNSAPLDSAAPNPKPKPVSLLSQALKSPSTPVPLLGNGCS